MEMKIVNLEINGKKIQALDGDTVLNAARKNGIEIPTLCYSPLLPPYGSCLLCVVEVDQVTKPLASCVTFVREGMKVVTDNEKIHKARKIALEMLLSNHYADCYGPCHQTCPAGVDVQTYLALAKAGKYYEALEVIQKDNPFPLVCGRVCVRYCEAACRRHQVDSGVAVNFVKRYLADLEADNLPRLKTQKSTGKKVAVVGGGPAGMSATHYLTLKGHQVELFEKHNKLGGMLRWGIPDYRLPQAVLDREISRVLPEGVIVHTEVDFGQDLDLAELKRRGFDAIFLAVGSQNAKKMRVKNEDSVGVESGIDFLEKIKKEGPCDFNGQRVMVVGGGNTAIDAARTAIRCKAAEVRILYRRTRDEMPADDVEIVDALEEKVIIDFLVAPNEVLHDKDGKLRAIKCIKMELGAPDDSGRRRPVPIENSDFEQTCDFIISAIGQEGDLAWAKGKGNLGLGISGWKTIETETGTFKTNIDGVFAGGDVVTGPMAAIDAIADGKKAASIIDNFLVSGKAVLPASEFVSSKKNWGDVECSFAEEIEPLARSTMKQAAVLTRSQEFSEVDLGVEELDVKRETERCLSCGCADLYICDLKKYCQEYGAQQTTFLGRVNKYKIDRRHPYIELDPNKCILCGKCVKTCDELQGVAALGFVNRGSEMIVKPALEKSLRETTCVDCGNCIEVCPTGAITYNRYMERPCFEEMVPMESVCQACSVGCQLVFHKHDDHFWYVTSKMQDKYSQGELCFRGRFESREIIKNNRLIAPKIRDNSVGDNSFFKEVTFDRAIKRTLERLKEIKDKYGPESLAFIVSPTSTNEEIFLMRKIAQDHFSLENFVSSTDLNDGNILTSLAAELVRWPNMVTTDDLDNAEVIVAVNCDFTRTAPVIPFKLYRAKMKGAKVISVGYKKTASRGYTDQLTVKAGSLGHLWGAITRNYLQGNGSSKNILEKLLKSLNQRYQDFINYTGLTVEQVKELGEQVSDRQKKVVFLYMPDAPENNLKDLQALGDYLKVTNRISQKASGLLLVNAMGNQQGYYNIGLGPSVDVEDGKNKIALLQTRISNKHIKGVFICGNELDGLEGERPLQKMMQKMVENADFLAAIATHHGPLTAAADVAIPGTLYAESAGTMTIMDGRTQSFLPAFDSPSGRTTLDVLAQILEALNGIVTQKENFSTVKDIRAAMAKEISSGASLSTVHDRFGMDNFCWEKL